MVLFLVFRFFSYSRKCSHCNVFLEHSVVHGLQRWQFRSMRG